MKRKYALGELVGFWAEGGESAVSQVERLLDAGYYILNASPTRQRILRHGRQLWKLCRHKNELGHCALCDQAGGRE